MRDGAWVPTSWRATWPISGLGVASGPSRADQDDARRLLPHGHGGVGDLRHRPLVVEPAPWPGNPSRAIDDTNLGKYFFEVIDTATNRVVYSRGFSSIFGEWETTGEARAAARTFQESLRFPKPERAVQVVVKKRDARNVFREVWWTKIDPADQFVDTSAPPSPGPVIELLKNGDPATKVDLLILGDGYTAAEQPKFRKDAERLVETLFATEPFKSRKSDFNVWGICPPAAESGISRPSTGVHRRSPIGASYDTFGSERYVLTTDNRAFRDAASFAPYDVVEILVNGKTYGGGGIYGLYATVAADSLWAPYVFVHEFGHHFAGLADEYYTSAVAYMPSPIESSRGSRTSRRCWMPRTSSGRRWRPGHAGADAVGEGRVRGALEGHPGPRRAIRAANKPESEMDALFLRSRKRRHADARARQVRARRRRLRGRELRGEGLLPSAGRLHHVHARRRAVLPGVPVVDRPRDRSVSR